MGGYIQSFSKIKIMKFLGILSLLFVLILSSCKVSNKSIQRQLKIEEGVSNPTTIEEIQDAIEKYDVRVRETQMAMSQIGIWYKMLGNRYLDNKMYGEALKCFQKAVEYYPANQNIYYYIGVCAGYMSKTALDYGAVGSNTQKYNYLKLAETAYLRALELDDRYTNAMFAVSILYVYELDESEKAVPYLEKLLTIDTKHTDAMLLLGHAYYLTGQNDKAVSSYDNVIKYTKSAEKKEAAENLKQQVLVGSGY